MLPDIRNNRCGPGPDIPTSHIGMQMQAGVVNGKVCIWSHNQSKWHLCIVLDLFDLRVAGQLVSRLEASDARGCGNDAGDVA